MEIPESIKQHAIRVAKGTDSYSTPERINDLLNAQRQEILARIKDYKEHKRNYFEAAKRQEEAKEWCEANGIKIEE